MGFCHSYNRAFHHAIVISICFLLIYTTYVRDVFEVGVFNATDTRPQGQGRDISRSLPHYLKVNIRTFQGQHSLQRIVIKRKMKLDVGA